MTRYDNNAKDIIPSPPRWHAFMCPGCRGLFRSPSTHSGNCSCPLCGFQCRVTPPAPDKVRIKKRRWTTARKEEDGTLIWEQDEEAQSRRARANARLFRNGAIFIITLISASVTAIFLLPDNFLENFEGKNIKSLRNPAPPTPFKVPAPPTGTTTPAETANDATEITILSTARLEEAEAVALEFLNAPDVDSLLATIRNSSELTPVIRTYYREIESYQPQNLKEIPDVTAVQTSGNFVSFIVPLADHSDKPIALELTDAGPKVDWESWVGYCEIPWDRLIEKKTTRETLVRVLVSPESYYNFAFKDDYKWENYRLTHSTNHPSLYGYVPATSPLVAKLPLPSSGAKSYILKIRYPDDAKSSNQVLITDVVSEGWVEGLLATNDSPNSP